MDEIKSLYQECVTAIKKNRLDIKVALPGREATSSQIRLIDGDRNSPWGTVVSIKNNEIVASFKPIEVKNYINKLNLLPQPKPKNKTLIQKKGPTPLSHMFGVRVTAETAIAIKNTGIDPSDFIRSAIDAALKNIIEG
jgi:hypothetical protein